MHRVIRASACLLVLAAAASAQAQVHRCGGTNSYTDKPCESPVAVDERSNLMNAGPRDVAPQQTVTPAPALILKNVSRVVDTPEPNQSTIWDDQRRRDADHASRTGPYTR
jgi:hypothetical protein